MQVRIVELLSQKLASAIREVDLINQEKVLAEWSLINPSPQCPYISDLMNRIHSGLVAGLREKERLAKDIVITTLNPFRKYLTTELAQEIMDRINTLFTENDLLNLVEKTPDVYNRSNAQKNKFNQDAYFLDFSLISLSAINISRQSLANIQIVIDELLLRETIAKPVKLTWWKHLLHIIWKFTKSIWKWIFGIVTAVIIIKLGG